MSAKTSLILIAVFCIIAALAPYTAFGILTLPALVLAAVSFYHLIETVEKEM